MMFDPTIKLASASAIDISSTVSCVYEISCGKFNGGSIIYLKT